jgi:tetratricopeptide (TPR) repeat protein
MSNVRPHLNEIELFDSLCREHRFAEALPLIEELVARAPHIDTSWFNYGYVLGSLGRQLEAAEAYLKAAKLDPQKRGLFSACTTLAGADATVRLLEVFTEQLEQDPWMLSNFKGGELARFWELPEFKQLEAKYGEQGQ